MCYSCLLLSQPFLPVSHTFTALLILKHFMSEVGKQNKEKNGKATLTVLALHTHKHYLLHTTFRYKSTVKNEIKQFMVLFIHFLQITCKTILLMQQSHGKIQDLVEVTGQAAGIFRQCHISALSSVWKIRIISFKTMHDPNINTEL